MDRIREKGFRYFLCFTVGIVVGALVGIVSISILISYRIDKYHERIKYLESLVEEKDIKLKKLEESINKSKVVLKSIDIVLMYEGDNLDKIALEKVIKEKYNNMLGKEIKDIDIDMIGEIINQRIMKLDEKEYKLSVSKIVLGEELKIWIDVKLIE